MSLEEPWSRTSSPRDPTPGQPCSGIYVEHPQSASGTRHPPSESTLVARGLDQHTILFDPLLGDFFFFFFETVERESDVKLWFGGYFSM